MTGNLRMRKRGNGLMVNSQSGYYHRRNKLVRTNSGRINNIKAINTSNIYFPIFCLETGILVKLVTLQAIFPGVVQERFSFGIVN